MRPHKIFIRSGTGLVVLFFALSVISCWAAPVLWSRTIVVSTSHDIYHEFSPGWVPRQVVRLRPNFRFEFAACVKINKVWAVEHVLALWIDEYLRRLLRDWGGRIYRPQQAENSNDDGTQLGKHCALLAFVFQQ